MMDIAITKISSKGQIVIPTHLRKGIAVGEQFVIIRDHDRIIMKKIKDVSNKFKEDLEFAQHVEKAWKRYEKTKFKSLSADKFLEELNKC